MRQIRTFNLAKHVVDDLNREIRRGYRSKFVQDAIQDKLNRKANFELHDFKTSELLLHIRNTRFTVLNDLDKLFLDNLVDQLREKGE
jgi:metal-responsive CopG/Arc/MetJ family transcriptional regulator